jgi:membrane protease YdiL (CAAX protease family)
MNMRRSCAHVLFLIVLGLSSLLSVNAFSRSQHAIVHKSLLQKPAWKRSIHLRYKEQRRKVTQVHFSLQKEDPLYDSRTTVALIGGQSLLIVCAAVAALILRTPNFGLGSGISFDEEALTQGALYAIPLFVLAYLLDTVEDRFPALQDVTKATQRSVIALLGGTFKPILALVTSVALGLVAGFGEEMLFRGVLQYELAIRFGNILAIGASSLVFGAVHAVTPLYALLATLASIFFGLLYQGYDNLAVPISTHTVYDIGALLWAHWTVTQMSAEEQEELVNWSGPNSRDDA